VLAAFLLALYPGHVSSSLHFLSETPYGFWLTVAATFTVHALAAPHRPAPMILGGIAWGLAILTRVEMIVAIFFAYIGLMFADSSVRRRFGRVLLWHTAVVLLVVLPWVIRNKIVLDVTSLSTLGGQTFFGAHNSLTFTEWRHAGTWLNLKEIYPDAFRATSEVGRDHAAWQYGLQAVREHVTMMPWLLLMKAWRLIWPFFETDNALALWTMALGWAGVFPFVLWGTVVICRDRSDTLESAAWYVIGIPLASVVMVTFVFYGSHRFRDALSPLFLLIATSGILDVLKTTSAVPAVSSRLRDRQTSHPAASFD
jgi:4-amino-4-deoxy-L-arabinose transferase-like glycosyltransferase